jgi:hypothetical protein
MERTELTVAELSSLLRMIQVIPDADNVGRIHEMLLAFCTAWRTIGVRRAFLLLVDEKGRVLRGHLAAEQLPGDTTPAGSFESLARRVVESTERLDKSDLTLKTRTFSVPLDWQRCGAAKSAITGVPLVADRRASEFGSDPFFDYFGTQTYVAIPLRVRGKVSAVLAAKGATVGGERHQDRRSVTTAARARSRPGGGSSVLSRRRPPAGSAE